MQDKAGLGSARLGCKHSSARHGAAWQGSPRRVEAWQGFSRAWRVRAMQAVVGRGEAWLGCGESRHGWAWLRKVWPGLVWPG